MSRLAVAGALALSIALGTTSCTNQVPPDIGELKDSLVVCGSGPIVEGIDVSYYQGTINWSAVAGDGIKFAIVRVSDGTTFRDPQFSNNWNGARAAGLYRGVYQFFRPQQDPIAQADIVVAAVGRLGPGDLPAVCDVEAPSPGVTPAQYTAVLHRWVDRVTAGTGRAPIIYTGRYYWDPYVASNDFNTLPLWHAQYTSAACPNINDRWSDWAMWQYTSSGRVAGISGNVDRNRWNGTLEQLAEFANSNRAPIGYLESAACTGVVGWAQDPDMADAPIDVHVYFDGPAGDPAAVGVVGHADGYRDDLCTALGSCEHGFVVRPPLSFFDGADHEVHAYGIDSMGGTNAELAGSPTTLHCDAPPVPMPVAGVVRRHVPSPDVLAAWGFDFVDVAPLSDAMLDAIPDGPDVVASPDLVQATGDPAVYVLENRTLRHVPSPAALAAWGFDVGAIRAVMPAALDPELVGAPLLDAPFLARGSGPEVYLVDAAPPLWAELVTDNVPSVIASGRSTEVSFRFRNRGSHDWTPGEVMLAPTPRDVASEVCDAGWPSCTRAATVASPTAPGEEGVFTVRLAGPVDPGPLTVCFGLVLDDHWFSDVGQNGPADDAICRTVEVVPAGEIDAGASDADGSVVPDDGRYLTSSCACRASGPAPASRSLALGLLVLGLVLARRRRRA